MKLTAVKNMKFIDETGERIDMEIQLSVFGEEWLPFTASKNDVEENGRKIYQAAVSGKLGQIEPF
jgi:hypothetical protein